MVFCGDPREIREFAKNANRNAGLIALSDFLMPFFHFGGKRV